MPFMASDPRIGGHVRDRVVCCEKAVRFQMTVQHAIKTSGLLRITLDGIRYRLRGRAQEVVHLTEHRSYAPHLEHQPLHALELIGDVRRQETTGLPCQVKQDRARLEQLERLSL